MSTTIGVKQLYRELKNIARDTKKGKSFLVMNRSEPLFRIEPVAVKPQKGLEAFFNIHFKGDKNLSKDIDKILYGGK
jgi:hypothetical protein